MAAGAGLSAVTALRLSLSWILRRQSPCSRQRQEENDHAIGSDDGGVVSRSLGGGRRTGREGDEGPAALRRSEMHAVPFGRRQGQQKRSTRRCGEQALRRRDPALA